MADAKFTVDYSDIKALHAELGKTSKEFQGMVRSVDPAINAAETFSRKIDVLNSEFKEGQRDSALYKRTFDSIQQQARMAGVELDRFGNFVALSNKNLRHQQLLVQQAGYQFGDFFTQISMGQNPLMAFTTQMTQLSGFLQGKWVPYFGIALSAVGAIGVAMMNAQKNAKDLKKDFDDLVSSISDYNDLLADTSKSQEDLTKEFGAFSSYATQAIEALKELAEIRMNEKLDQIANGMGNLEAGATNLNLRVREFLDLNSKLSGNKAREAAAPFIVALRELQTAEGPEAQLKATSDLITLFEDFKNTYGSLNEEAEAYYSGLLNVQMELSKTGAVAQEQATKTSETLRKGYEWGTEFWMAYQEHLDDLNDGGATAQKYYERLQSASQYMSRASGEYYKQLVEQSAIEGDIADKIQDALESSQSLSTLNIDGGIARAAEVARLLADRLNMSLENAREIVNIATNQVTTAADSNGPSLYNTKGQIVLPPTGGGTTLDKPSGGAKKRTVKDFLKDLEEEVAYKKKIIGLSDEQVKIEEILYDAQRQGLEVKREQIQLLAEEAYAAEQAAKQHEDFKSILLSGMESLITGSKSVEDAFNDTIRNILLSVYRSKIMEPLATAGADFLFNMFQANGGAWNKGVQMYADGGVVSSPTMFGHSGGLGVMGEAGPEAIMPLKRGANGKLGVQMEGGSGAISVVNNITVNGNDNPAAVRAELAKLMPQIEKATVNSVINARKRGGQMKAAFR